ncbi:uncharacterized protein [Mytilus edulis]|uniref:uncharacterized protein n=1 Tax=Mytilus edulis TaxID=6550 RepID=UPI0039EF6430
MGNQLSSCKTTKTKDELIPKSELLNGSNDEKSIEQKKQTIRLIRPRRRLNCSTTEYVESPFHPKSKPIRFGHLIVSDIDRRIQKGLENLKLDREHDGEAFNIPHFLRYYANSLRGMKIYLKYQSSNISENLFERFPEASYLIEHVKYLKVFLICHPAKRGDPLVMIKESQGNYTKKMLRKSRQRELDSRIQIVNGKSYTMFMGKDFMLMLHPPPRETCPSDFVEGNGERPTAMGYYTRMLDTNPQVILEWEAYVYHWYNAVPGPPFLVEELMEFGYPEVII